MWLRVCGLLGFVALGIVEAQPVAAEPGRSLASSQEEAALRNAAVAGGYPTAIGTPIVPDWTAVVCNPPACPNNRSVAFYAEGTAHCSYSVISALISYDQARTNFGGGWDNSSTFCAPCAGLYYFSASYVRDAFPPPYGPCPPDVGTADDISVYITTQGNTFANAWTGEGDGARATATASCVLYLNRGDQVQTWTNSDGGARRALRNLSFTGYLLK